MKPRVFFTITLSAVLIAMATFFIITRGETTQHAWHDQYTVDTMPKTPIPIAQIVEHSRVGTQSASMERPVATETASLASSPAKLRLPIITYHYVEFVKDKKDTIRQKLTINPRLFEQQVKSLHDAGVQTYFVKEVPALVRGDLQLASKSAVLTFDDGYRDFYTDAFPILKKYQIKSTIFLISSFLGRSDFLTLDQVTEMLGSGLIEVGSHTLHHVNLKKANLNTATVEIAQSKTNLEKLFGISVESFAYPYGAYDDQAVRLVKEASYSAAVSTVPGAFHTQDDLFILKRWRAGVLDGVYSSASLDALQ